MSAVKSIYISETLPSLNNKKYKKTKKNSNYRNLISPQKIKNIIKNRKKTLKSTNMDLKKRQNFIQEQVLKANNFKDIYNQINNHFKKDECINKFNVNVQEDENVQEENVQENISLEENVIVQEGVNEQEDVKVNKQENFIEEYDYDVDYKDNKKEKKISFYKTPKKGILKNKLKSKRNKVKFKSVRKTKSYSKETIDSFFKDIQRQSNKKTDKNKIYKLIGLLKKIVNLDKPELKNRFIKKLKRNYVINLLCLFNVCHKKTKAPLKLLKFILYVSCFDTIKIIKL